MSGTERYTLDTNILFYAVDTDAGSKHRIAEQIINVAVESDCLVTLQALGELYNAISRRRPQHRTAAERLIRLLSGSMAVVPVSVSDLTQAIEQHSQRQIQFWDTLLWATARRHGCRTILTEDAQDRFVVAGVRYINPFTAPAADLVGYLQ